MREAVDERGAQDADHGIAGERARSEPPDLERRRVELEDSESWKRERSELCSDCAHCLAEPKAIEVSSNSEGQSGRRPHALIDVATEPRGGGPPRSVARATHVRRIYALRIGQILAGLTQRDGPGTAKRLCVSPMHTPLDGEVRASLSSPGGEERRGRALVRR